MMQDEETLSVTQAADALGVDASDVVGLVFERQLGFITSRSGRIRIPRAALEEFKQRAASTSSG